MIRSADMYTLNVFGVCGGEVLCVLGGGVEKGRKFMKYVGSR